MLEERARENPEATAIAAPGLPPLSYGRLLRHVRDVAQTLRASGVGGNDRVALVLPNGPEMATAFLAVASGAVCAPLNPAYRQGEFDFFLSDLGAKVLVVQEGTGGSAVAAARSRGIPVLTLSVDPGAEAGIFTLSGGGDMRRPADVLAASGDVALVLHTSGTTSRPKIVPLTHSNLLTSARSIRETLALRESDRCLNAMPLFHVHGLVGALLSSLSTGASVVCLSRFDASDFLRCLQEYRPTWYTAVPAIHQSLLEAASAHRGTVSRFPLRFIRSCSAPLPRKVMDGLETAFRVPVVEAYGMTEASHQVASNPLPPGVRKPGSVGKATGTVVAILDAEGNRLATGKTGEVAIRGDNVMRGYENDPEADAEAFTGGWFRTGDLGYVDRDGYLFLTGRLKEVINRGGYKVSPAEIDAVLLEHPRVARALAFAIPHPTLGEDIAAAVVPEGNGPLAEREVREFALSRLAEYKAPVRVLIVDEIPKGPTGKPQRTGMAGKLEHLLKADFQPPRDGLESDLKEIWQWILGVPSIGIRDNFFELGGNSLLAVQMFAHIGEHFGKTLPLSTLFHAPTIGELAEVIRREGWTPRWDFLVPVQPSGGRPPFFCVHPHDGNVFRFRDLAMMLGADQPFYGVRPGTAAGVDPSRLDIGEMAEKYVEEIRRMQPEGPYFLGGECLGGIIAVEMACRLLEKGEKVAFVALIFSYAPGYPSLRPGRSLLRKAYDRIRTRIDRMATMYPLIGPSEWGNYFRAMRENDLRSCRNFLSRLYYRLFTSYGDSFLRREDERAALLRERVRGFGMAPYPGRLTLFRMQKEPMGFIPTGDWGWGKIAAGGLEVRVMPGYATGNYRSGPGLRLLAGQFKECLEKAQADGS